MDTKNVNSKVELSIGQWFIIFAGVFILIAIGINAGINSDTGVSQGIALTSDGIKPINSNDFTILREETTYTRDNNGIFTVKGKIKQNIEGSYTGLMLTLDLLNVNKEKVRETTGLIYTNYLGNNIWEFEVSGNDADNVVTDYEISYCYGY